jgi:hypothetical protein
MAILIAFVVGMVVGAGWIAHYLTSRDLIK